MPNRMIRNMPTVREVKSGIDISLSVPLVVALLLSFELVTDCFDIKLAVDQRWDFNGANGIASVAVVVAAAAVVMYATISYSVDCKV